MDVRYELVFIRIPHGPATVVPLSSWRLARRLRREMRRQGCHVQIGDRVKRIAYCG